MGTGTADSSHEAHARATDQLSEGMTQAAGGSSCGWRTYGNL
jgi:hypothetical protein